MAMAMDGRGPGPPSRRAGRGASRWKGWNRRSTSAAGMTCPELLTDRTAPSELYVRTVNTPAATTRVDNLLAAQANPENPSEVDVSQPSDTLTAQADAP